MPTLTATGPVHMLDFGADENRFAPPWLDEVHAHLDTVTAGKEPAALVTIGRGKYYSNGLDLDWLTSHPDDAGKYVAGIHDLFARVLALPVPTIAAVNGHAFGGGAMLAMAHDFRIMREDRGYFCFPEADLNLPFTPGMAALVQAKLTPAAAVASMTTGGRFGGPQAKALGLVDATAALEDLRTAAIDRVAPLAGKDRGTLGAIKSTMFGPALTALREAGN
ncbi:enoyl-CoA hydratase/isomerase family protein [Amycolatopsis echigonensis]|uniref:Enoyl-CoA hydratase/isomerase family protein n=1 Tax=Amycolatopsis echigonensis TaxID=2576905 RepID=A0A8E1W7W1_9PSEU|nr:enoyl-CoA hydratase/isomerase family protein [Amycolatopsis echigonensis]MBB2505736.1 enoyl-CoA hydratase/isomerase family protein [Amycolatopsis echigonensis]